MTMTNVPGLWAQGHFDWLPFRLKINLTWEGVFPPPLLLSMILIHKVWAKAL